MIRPPLIRYPGWVLCDPARQLRPSLPMPSDHWFTRAARSLESQRNSRLAANDTSVTTFVSSVASARRIESESDWAACCPDAWSFLDAINSSRYAA